MSDALTNISRDQARAKRERELYRLIIDGWNERSLHHESYHKLILAKAKECDSIRTGYFSTSTKHAKNFNDFLRGASFILEYLEELYGEQQIPVTYHALQEFFRKKEKYLKGG